MKLYKRKFCELYEMSSGISTKPEQSGHGSPFLSFSSVFKNYFLEDNLKDLMYTSKNEQNKYSIKKGDIFLTRTSETIHELGMSSVALKDYENATYSGFLKRLRPIQNDQTYYKYMAFYLRSKLFRDTMTNNAVLTLRASLNEDIFSYIDLLLPPYEEQKKIGDFLFLIQEKLKTNNKIFSKLENIIEEIFRQWFIQFQFPDSNGKAYKSNNGEMVYSKTLKKEIPIGWDCLTLSEVIDNVRTGLNPRKHFSLGEGKNFYVTIKNINQSKVILDDKCDMINDEAIKIINKRSDLKSGDILFTSIEPVGTTYLISKKPNNWNINESVFSIRPDKNKISSEILYLLLGSKEMKAYTKNVSAGSIHKGIRIELLKTFNFCFGPKEIMTNFTQIIKPKFDYLKKIEEENSKLINLRDWILPMLINGQIKI